MSEVSNVTLMIHDRRPCSVYCLFTFSFVFVVELRITRGPVSATVLLNSPHDFHCDTTFSDVITPPPQPSADNHDTNAADNNEDTNTTTTRNNTVTLPTTPLPSTASSSRPQRRVTVTWQKDGENVRRSGDDYRVRRRTGRLHFFHVRYSDRGNYRCIVQSNGVKIHSSYAKLVVHGKGPFTPGIY